MFGFVKRRNHRTAGDTAAVGGDPPSWRILGRTSVDMITSGGYRISSLELENVLARHPRISEVAVLGMPHPDLGEQVGRKRRNHVGKEITSLRMCKMKESL